MENPLIYISQVRLRICAFNIVNGKESSKISKRTFKSAQLKWLSNSVTYQVAHHIAKSTNIFVEIYNSSQLQLKHNNINLANQLRVVINQNQLWQKQQWHPTIIQSFVYFYNNISLLQCHWMAPAYAGIGIRMYTLLPMLMITKKLFLIDSKYKHHLHLHNN